MPRSTRALGFIAAVAIAIASLAATAPHARAAEAPLVVIDPGHGGPYSNANANRVREKTANLQIALELRRQLTSRGYRVVMTRTTDRALTFADIPTWNYNGFTDRWSLGRDGRRLTGGVPRDDLQARVNIANRLGADLFISIHNNGAASTRARGTETLASPRDPFGRQLSPIVQRRVAYRAGLLNRRYKTMDLYVCRWSNMPAILVEGAFITNYSDARKLRSWTYRRRIAVGIAEGVDTWWRANPPRRLWPRAGATDAASSALRVSQETYPAGAPAVVIARETHASELAGAPALAARLGGPLLWISPSGPDSQTLSQITRLAPQRIIAVGLTGSLDATLVSSLTSASSLPSAAVEPLERPGRAALAAAIAASMGPSPSGRVLVAPAEDPAAALGAASLAVRERLPLLLTENGALGAEAASFVSATQPTSALLLGQVPSGASGVAVETRVGGVGTAGVAAGINDLTYRQPMLTPVVADARFPATYLTSSTYAALHGEPLIPVSGKVLPDPTRLWITNRRPAIIGFTIFDAPGGVPPLVDRMLKKADG